LRQNDIGLMIWAPAFGTTFRWLTGVKHLRLSTFNVAAEFLSLFIHGFKTGESRDTLIVANMAMHDQAWVAIFYKKAPGRSNIGAHVHDLVSTRQILQDKHGFPDDAACTWALEPPTEPPTGARGFETSMI